MWHNLYAKTFTKVLGLFGCQVTSNILDIRNSGRNFKDYKNFQRGQRSHLRSDSSDKQAILYGAAKIHKNSIMGTICVYKWIDMMTGMDLDKIVHNDREPRHARILNAWIEDWESYILRTQDQENGQCLLKKYKNIRFLDDEDNQTYMIAQENLEFKGPTRRNKQYCVVGKTLDWKDGYNLDLLISRYIVDNFMVLIKRVEQDPDLGVKTFHT